MNTADILKEIAGSDEHFEVTIRGGVEIISWDEDATGISQPTQLEIESYDMLPWAKDKAKIRIKKVASKKVYDLYPFIDPVSEQSMGLYHLVLDIYLSIKPASRESLSGRLLTFKSIYDAALAAIAEIELITDVTAVQNYDAVNTPNWP
jgi:hypothetical protein